MKRIMTIIAAAAAGFMTTGCINNWGNGNDVQYLRLKTLEETEGGVTTTTTYEWNESGAPSGETCKQGDQTVYSDGNYAYDGRTVTFDRTYPAREPEKRKITYLDDKFVTITGIYVYDAAGSVEKESRVETYGSNGQLSRYEHKVDGETILLHTDFDYGYPYVYYNIKELVGTEMVDKRAVRTYLNGSYSRMACEVIMLAGSDEEIRRIDYKYNEGGGYEYRGYIVKEYGKVIESQDNYLASNNTISYDLIKYDADEQPLSTKKVKRTYVRSDY